MLLVSAGFKAAILGPQSFADIFNGGEIRVFAGARPNAPELPEPSLPLGMIRRLGANTTLQFALAGAFVVKLPTDLWQLVAQQTGSPTWFRLVAPGDDYGYDANAARIDGDISLSGGGGDMIVAASSITAGSATSIDQFYYTISPVQGA